MKLRLSGAERNCVIHPPPAAPSLLSRPLPPQTVSMTSQFPFTASPPSALSSLLTAVSFVQVLISLAAVVALAPCRHLHADTVFCINKLVMSFQKKFFYLFRCFLIVCGGSIVFRLLLYPDPLQMKFVPCPQDTSSYLALCLCLGTSST